MYVAFPDSPKSSREIWAAFTAVVASLLPEATDVRVSPRRVKLSNGSFGDQQIHFFLTEVLCLVIAEEEMVCGVVDSFLPLAVRNGLEDWTRGRIEKRTDARR